MFVGFCSVRRRAKSGRWAGLEPGPRRPMSWAPRCRRRTVQTGSHGNPGCATVFSASPRGPSPPRGSRPAPWRRTSGSSPSSWREETQQELASAARRSRGRWSEPGAKTGSRPGATELGTPGAQRRHNKQPTLGLRSKVPTRHRGLSRATPRWMSTRPPLAAYISPSPSMCSYCAPGVR